MVVVGRARAAAATVGRWARVAAHAGRSAACVNLERLLDWSERLIVIGDRRWRELAASGPRVMVAGARLKVGQLALFKTHLQWDIVVVVVVIVVVVVEDDVGRRHDGETLVDPWIILLKMN